MNTDYEKLGAFYLGREVDADSGKTRAEPLLIDSRDLTTHAVCVGMTGSGKTGLCLAALEEAAIDGIPAICIDPKGDIANLLLTFPELAPADFMPWVDPQEAARANLSIEQLASKTAAGWKQSLADWDQGPERIARLRSAATVSVYTPGANTGLGLSVLRSLANPGTAAAGDAAALSEQIGSIAAALLALLGRDADPVKSRDYILLARLIEQSWQAGTSLDLAGLIQAIQKPGLEQIGAFDLETFYPAKERLELAMAVNSLLASPGFAAWTQGEAARRAAPAVRDRRQAARQHHFHLAPERRRAHVHRHAGAQRAGRVDAAPERHFQPAGAVLHGRDLRLLSAERKPAVQAADADAPQAGPGLRPGLPAGDAESGRPGLSRPRQRRHLADRSPADRARQGARHRRAHQRRRRRGAGP